MRANWYTRHTQPGEKASPSGEKAPAERRRPEGRSSRAREESAPVGPPRSRARSRTAGDRNSEAERSRREGSQPPKVEELSSAPPGGSHAYFLDAYNRRRQERLREQRQKEDEPPPARAAPAPPPPPSRREEPPRQPDRRDREPDRRDREPDRRDREPDRRDREPDRQDMKEVMERQAEEERRQVEELKRRADESLLDAPHAERRSSRGAATARAAGPVLTLGTRGSPLALAQAYEAKRRLGEAFPELADDEAGSWKSGQGFPGWLGDVPTELIPDTELCTMLPREDTRDVLISGDPEKIKCIEDFPEIWKNCLGLDGSLIGTASLRRQAQIYSKNPNVKCVNFRGNVQTRLRKLQGGDVKGTFLAYAGLKRMSMEDVLEWDEMLPAIAQGAISFQCRSDDERVLNYLKPLSHDDTFQSVTCERAFLAALDGNCKTPIAGQAKVIDGELHLKGLVASPDGKQIFRTERTGKVSEATEIGRDAGNEIRKEAGEAFFQEMQETPRGAERNAGGGSSGGRCTGGRTGGAGDLSKRGDLRTK
eukprot:g24276.t1